MNDSIVVVGVFPVHNDAEQALTELRTHGFAEDHIGFVVRDSADNRTATEKLPMAAEPEQGDNTTTGAVAGGVVGGVVGAVAALLIPGIGPAFTGGILSTTIGAALGAVTGGFIGSLQKLGVPEEEARYYNQELQAGRTIVIVQADDRPIEAFKILERNHAYNPSSDLSDSSDDSEDTIKLPKIDRPANNA